jgi:hypothetical protein
LFVLAVAACTDSVTADPDPPGSLVGLAAGVEGHRVRLSWVEPGDRDVVGSLVVRFPATGVDGEPEAGRSYFAGEPLGTGQAIFAGRGTEVTDNPPCREHVYAGWARDASGNWSVAPGTVRVGGLPGSALPAPPSGLAAAVVGAGISLTWTPPASTAASVLVVRRPQFPPVHPRDGEAVYSGAAASALDPSADLSPLVTWHYAAFSCNPCGDCEPEGSRTTVTPTLMQSLRVGGFVIYWRHGTATTCVDRQELGIASMPMVAGWWMSCDRACPPAGNATARQLSPEGYAEAVAIGNALRARGIPFSRVLSSEYCRCRETAERMALGPTIETLQAITFFVYPEVDRCPAAQALFAELPAPGTNTAIVGHLYPECMDLAMGEAAIYQPDGSGGFALVDKVLASEWAGLP